MIDKVVNQEPAEAVVLDPALETPKEETPAAAEPEKKKDGFQEAINRQTRKLYEQKARADLLEAKVRQLEAGRSPVVNQDAPPDRSQFTTDDDHNKALIQHEARKIAKEEIGRMTQEDQNRQVRSKWQKDAETVRKASDDFDEVVGDFTASQLVTPAMDKAILESDRPAAVTHYLATHLEAAEKIAAMSDYRAAIEIGKIEAQLTAKEKTPAQKVSAAPAPIAPIGAKGNGGEIDPEKESPKEFAARRNKERAQQGKR